MAALDAAHAALALGLPTLISPRMSAGDPRPRHLGLSHHTLSVLELLLGGVEVPVPVRPRASSGPRAHGGHVEAIAAAPTGGAATGRGSSGPTSTGTRASGLPTADDGPRPRARTGCSSPRRLPPARRSGGRRRHLDARDPAWRVGCTGRAGPRCRRNSRCVSSVAESAGPGVDRALRSAAARLPRLPRVRARPVAQHAERLPDRPAPVRHLPRRARLEPAQGEERRRLRLPRRAGPRQRQAAVCGPRP